MRTEFTRPRPPLGVHDLEAVRAQLGDVLEDLRGAQVFLTGGTGFFGRWLVESFVHLITTDRLNATLTVLSRDPARFLASAPHLAVEPLRFVQGDVRDFAFPDRKFTHVIHAATEASDRLNSEDPLAMFDVIVQGTRRVLDFAVRSGVSRMLFVSSGAVYGPQPSDVSHISEDMFFGFAPNDPKHAYAEGKRAAEFLCSAYARKFGMVIPIARCFAFVGPHLPLDAHFAIGNFIDDRLHGRPIRVAGDGTPTRSYLYASDMAAWLWKILLRGASVRAYNVGSDQAISIRELAGMIAEPAGLEVAVLGTSRPGQARNQYVPSVRRAIDEIGCTMRVPLAAAIAETLWWNERRR